MQGTLIVSEYLRANVIWYRDGAMKVELTLRDRKAAPWTPIGQVDGRTLSYKGAYSA